MTIEQTNAQDCDQAPIHCLPDEILEAIFLINTVYSELIEQGNEKHPYDPHSTTLATTQVCQRWRAVALDYPVIWSRIIDYEKHSPLWIETLLARSGSALIDVIGPVRLFNHPRGEPVLQSIFQRITYLKTVSLHIHRDLWESTCHSFLGHPAPNLEFLDLVISCPFPDYLYPNPLFADEAPCLRRLSLHSCLIDFSSSVLSNLTELTVMHVIPPAVIFASARSHWLEVLPNVAGWLRILKNMPALRFLSLWDAIPHFTGHESEPLPVLDLPHLDLLMLNTRFYLGISLIDHLNIPPLCGIAFQAYPSYDRSTEGLDSHKLLSFLSKQLTHWSQDCSDRNLQAETNSDGWIQFRNSIHIGKVSLYSKDPTLSLDLTFNHLEHSFAFFNQFLELYSSTFSTTTTLDLRVDQGTAIANGSFPAFPTFRSSSFTNVKTLNLERESPLYLLPLFQHSSLPGHPLFPALQSLHLIWTEMDDEEGAMCRVFVAFLQSRVEAGLPLREIKMIGGCISKQTAEILSRIGNLRVSLDSIEKY